MKANTAELIGRDDYTPSCSPPKTDVGYSVTVRDRKWRVDPRQMWCGFQSERSVKILEESSQTGSVSLRPRNSSDILKICIVRHLYFFFQHPATSPATSQSLTVKQCAENNHLSDESRAVKVIMSKAESVFQFPLSCQVYRKSLRPHRQIRRSCFFIKQKINSAFKC